MDKISILGVPSPSRSIDIDAKPNMHTAGRVLRASRSFDRLALCLRYGEEEPNSLLFSDKCLFSLSGPLHDSTDPDPPSPFFPGLRWIWLQQWQESLWLNTSVALCAGWRLVLGFPGPLGRSHLQRNGLARPLSQSALSLSVVAAGPSASHKLTLFVFTQSDCSATSAESGGGGGWGGGQFVGCVAFGFCFDLLWLSPNERA